MLAGFPLLPWYTDTTGHVVDVPLSDTLRDRMIAPPPAPEGSSSPTWWQYVSAVPGGVADTFGLSRRPGAVVAIDVPAGVQAVGRTLGEGLREAVDPIKWPLLIAAVLVVGLLLLTRRV